MKSASFYRCTGVMLIAFLSSIAPVPGWAASPPHLRLMPLPAQMTLGDGKMVIEADFRVALSGYQEPRIQNAVGRFLQRLQDRTGVPFSGEPLTSAEKATFIVNCEAAGEAVQSVRADESYSLEIAPNRARLSAPSPLGIVRGLETFLQLVDIDGESLGVPAVKISDHPRFPWRGLMI